MPGPWKGLSMMSLLIGSSLVAGIGLGWFGCKASRRIAQWGRNMNEVDRIFQMADEQSGGFEVMQKRPAQGVHAVGPHRIGIVASK